MKAEDLQSILNLKKKQEGLIDPEFGARHRAFDIPNFDEVINKANTLKSRTQIDFKWLKMT